MNVGKELQVVAKDRQIEGSTAEFLTLKEQILKLVPCKFSALSKTINTENQRNLLNRC